jgi:hypothetical protein
MGELRYSSTLLGFGTSWRWVIFWLEPLYPWGNTSWCPLYRRLIGPQSRYGRCDDEKNLALAGIRTPAIQPLARCYTDWALQTENSAGSLSNLHRTLYCSLNSRPEQAVSLQRSRILSWRCWVRISAGTPGVLTKVFVTFIKSPQANAGLVPRSGHDNFLIRCHQSHQHSTLYSRGTDSDAK